MKPKMEFMCEICFDPKPKDDSFPIKGCSHSYCKDCMANYVGSKLQDNISQISCPVPKCSGFLEPHDCRPILPQEVFDRWGNALCEALILGSQKFYCPYKDCSLMLVDDGSETVRESECPNCRRLFCAQCKVPWHAEIECAEFQKLHKDEREKEDIMLMKLAGNKHWMRCPKCRVFVERIEGCRYIKCRCGASFCYGCGSEKISITTHYCSVCKSTY
ncbi:RING/U-box superfamily protein [Euphorbia peplus]|nr:RING/U-box superfamily protein [Euphorbia peplus]